jgi:hypothetical protein
MEAKVSSRAPNESYHVRLPVFLREDQEVGLGDAIKRATSLAGIKPCGGCSQRAEMMNRWLTFSGPRRSRH